MDILGMLPSFGGFFISLIAFIFALSVIVAVHEYGHYIVGRWSGIHADVFSLGFGPVLYSRFDKRGTKWQIAALPFGGYVKFRGDADAASARSVDISELNEADRRSTMQGAPLWARTATVAAGPLFNFALAMIMFFVLIVQEGQISKPLRVGEVFSMPQTQELEVGDRIVEVNGIDLPAIDSGSDFYDFIRALPPQDIYPYIVERNGRVIEVMAPTMSPARVTQVMPRSAAADAGLRSGDVFVQGNDVAINDFSTLKSIVEGSNGATVDLTIWRDGAELKVPLTPRRVDEPLAEGGFATQWRIGVVGGGLSFEPMKENISPLRALDAAAGTTYRIITASMSGLYHVITGAISSCNLSGPIGIAETSGQMVQQGSANFLWFVASLSVAIGFMNLLPIPVLDGGHLIFYAIEAVTGKPPSPRFLNLFMTIGLTIVLSFMVFAITNDLFC